MLKNPEIVPIRSPFPKEIHHPATNKKKKDKSFRLTIEKRIKTGGHHLYLLGNVVLFPEEFPNGKIHPEAKEI